MRDLEIHEVEAVSGGNVFLLVSIVFTAITISDGAHDFVEGYKEARNSR